MASGGEEFRFRLEPADAEDLLDKAGWTVGKVLAGPQLTAGYLSGTELAAVSSSTSGFAVKAARLNIRPG